MVNEKYRDNVRSTAVSYHNPMEQAVLVYLAEKGVAIAKEISSDLRVNKKTLSYYFKKFEADGLIKDVDTGNKKLKPRKLTKYGLDVVSVLKNEPLEDSDITKRISSSLLSEGSLKEAISFLEGKASAPEIDSDERERILNDVAKICYFAEVYRNRKK